MPILAEDSVEIDQDDGADESDIAHAWTQAALLAWAAIVTGMMLAAPLKIVGAAIVAGPLLAGVVFRRRARAVIAAAAHHLVWRRWFNAGQSPARVLTISAATIAIFAALYGTMCVSGAAKGDVVFFAPQGGYASITKDILEFPQPDGSIRYETTTSSAGLIARRSLYFSVATFTTLGHSTYQPHGRAQWLAMAEAICGLLLTAVFAASLVRRLLRT